MRVFTEDGVERTCSWFKVFGRAVLNPFLTAIAVWALIFSFRLILNVNDLMILIPYMTPFIVYSWAALYFVGGSLMLLGSARLNSRISASGCALFASSAFLNAIFVFSSHVEGYRWQAFNMVLFGIAALLRVRHLIKGEMLIWVRKH